MLAAAMQAALASPAMIGSDGAGSALRSVEPLDLGAEGAQPGVDALVAAVDLSDVVDGAGPVGGERG